jgi:hypothetical protein
LATSVYPIASVTTLADWARMKARYEENILADPRCQALSLPPYPDLYGLR